MLVFWTPNLWERSYEFSSVYLCTCLSVGVFFCNTFFFESILQFFRYCTGSANFRENSHYGKNASKDQKWPENRAFRLLKKMKSLVLSGNDLKLKFSYFFLWFLRIYKNCVSRKIGVLNLWSKILLANQI